MVDGASVAWRFDAVGRIAGEGVGVEVTLVAGEIGLLDCFEDRPAKTSLSRKGWVSR